MLTKLTFVIPLLNEEQNEVICNIFKLIDFLKFNYEELPEAEILIIDDASNPPFVFQEPAHFTKNNINIKVFYNKENLGKGSSIKRGFLESSGDILIMLDGDFPIHLNSLHFMINEVNNQQADIVIGSRKKINSKRIGSTNYLRSLASDIFIKFINLLILPNVSDTQCPMKVFDKDAGLQVFSHLISKRYAFDVEILLVARKYNLKVYEYPVIWEDKRSKWSFYHCFCVLFYTLWELVQIYITYKI